MKNHKRKNKKQNKIEILEPSKNNKIDKDELDKDNYPIFCFKYLSDTSIKKCVDPKFFVDFLLRLKKLSELGWHGIGNSTPHSYGMEPLPLHKIKPQIIEESITPDAKKLHIFRANGNNLPFIGIQIQKTFRILFIETKFGDIYDH